MNPGSFSYLTEISAGQVNLIPIAERDAGAKGRLSDFFVKAKELKD